ncbi:hypothetical protein PTSG_07866 [Salpingoeca rosetta]|uniref:Aminotransferase class V domain-containing protein n=1 Tax=Salpingoeca rosetta (strain ATCC 50818 / BSB-021) TaxID=946362 RepID=F2UGJ9_SALR5|nr:uncharacterized protein PTSG_07866 [Salpingoeca rosetta]EGD75749.1 hypothetical protein PTSG_07866 [Salpingoeca rosetta]|eukprot:XP_004991670.1 hypothetical protein PTSG_07866 [Salpingoeca rosetta]
MNDSKEHAETPHADNPGLDVRHLFAFVDDDKEEDRQVLYFNNAGRGPLLKSTEQVGIEALRTKSRPWAFADNEAMITDIRRMYLQALGLSREAAHLREHAVAMVPSTSYAMTLIARSLSIQQGQRVLVLHGQMSSNVMPWQCVCEEEGASLVVVQRNQLAHNTLQPWSDAVLNALDQHKGYIAAVALPNYLWSDGSHIDLDPIAAYCHEHNIPLVLDVTQSGGVVPLALDRLHPTAVACSVHKWLLGPYGFSLLYVDDALLTKQPLEFHDRRREHADEAWWDEVGAMTDMGYPTPFKPGACRFDSGGRPNYIGVPMLHDALQHLTTWGPAHITAYCTPLLDRLIVGARELGFQVPRSHAPHFVGLTPPVPSDQQHDAPVCPASVSNPDTAWPTMPRLAAAIQRHHHAFCSVRHGAIRVSVFLYTTTAHVDSFVAALATQLAAWRSRTPQP